jgi:hypothetical protein
MPLICVSEDAQLTKTSDVETNVQIKMPFVLNGSPMTTRPQSLRNLSTYRIKQSSSFKRFDQLNNSDYVLDNLLSENIIGADSNTTLRYESQTYTQKFIAIHSGIWDDRTPAVSIFFTARNDDMFHIYIPLTITGNDSPEENKFLKAWTNSSYTLPNPFSVNRLLEFSSENIPFRISNFCLKFNNAKKINHYTLCKFNTAHILNFQPANSWIGSSGLVMTAIPNGDSVSSYRRTTFNSIFNFMLNGTIVNQDNRNLISSVEHIATSAASPSVIKPVFYRVTKDQLFTTSKTCARGVKGLQNIKCYPLDLASQVDDNGNIFIDQDKKPIQVKNIGKDNMAAGESSGISPEQLALDQKENTDFIKYMIIFGVIFGLLIVIVIVFVYYFYRQRAAASAASASLIASVAAAPVTAASASLIASVAAAPVTPASSLATSPVTPASSLAAAPP